jgi:1-acyl-sn-glycerol-3-phosphate acyltransferase
MIFLRSALFMAWFLILSIIMSIIFLPLLAAPRKWCVWMARFWAKATLWGLKLFAGTGMRVIGSPPKGPMLVASKHMSMWDTLALYLLLDDPGIVLKRELLRIPFYGWFLWKNCAIAVDRGAGADAMRRMIRSATRVLEEGRPILIFPEGTRKKPGAEPDYKPGVVGLYALLKRSCVPVALDSGLYWHGFLKCPGDITVQFLEAVPPGLNRDAFMPLLQERIETATAALSAPKQPD